MEDEIKDTYRDLSLLISKERIMISMYNEKKNETITIVDWNANEQLVNSSRLISIAKAIHLYYTDPDLLVEQFNKILTCL